MVRYRLLALGLAVSLQVFDLGVWGAALYWKPTLGDTTYITQRNGGSPIVSNASGAARARRICSNYNWGFRFGGELSGAYLHFQDSSSAAAQFLYP